MDNLTKGRLLIQVEKLDIGDAKKLRIRSFVNRAFLKGKQDLIDLEKLSSMSRNDIVSWRISL